VVYRSVILHMARQRKPTAELCTLLCWGWCSTFSGASSAGDFMIGALRPAPVGAAIRGCRSHTGAAGGRGDRSCPGPSPRASLLRHWARPRSSVKTLCKITERQPQDRFVCETRGKPDLSSQNGRTQTQQPRQLVALHCGPIPRRSPRAT